MASNHITKIAIVGVTGTIGRHITSALLSTKKHTITAITRADSTNTTFLPAGVQIAKVDYTNKTTLVTALRGHQALIITLGVAASNDNTTERALIDAAAEAHVPWIMPNDYAPDFGGQPAFGEDALLGPGILATRRYIEHVGASWWVSLVCSYWYQHCLINPAAYGFDIPNKSVTFFDDGETKVTQSTLPQCGRAVAALFSLPIEAEKEGQPCLNDWKNRECYVSSFCVSQRDMWRSILRVTGDREEEWTVKAEPAYERWKSAKERFAAGEGMGRLVAMITRVFFQDGCGDLTAKLDDEKLGLEKEELDVQTREAVEMATKGQTYRDFGKGMKKA